ncbi:aldehyde dehydrogenase family protein [Nocardioides marmotae]|uniref:Aldehyde dehydrogenase family protein n=1 Tax=Nocardioides marmotae TaxID=2663857 RepID=A0A6I3IZH3_9ACTN|nr:aldehyde dehydrogenase family protein [Nocardioides marmotae]MCR6030880.1 aldehyde dehydrogenase family protein [Gordonia jinghuaiqii]MBC9731593.1 aldehyde dehydrogenase family protein [Nocardioides marmotae]MTB82715.1 aldehyde dehydrogenase family protein [Nocardioides marmotae]MTB94517.1 aldehyde dehydrogenase family protein [Nocardioides marmotae]QKE01466.1 aldehyde dehydrogenase family protein [Nocardioides marmotae]
MSSTTAIATPYEADYAAHRTTLERIRSRPWGLLIDNELRPAASGRTFTTFDPATELPLAEVADAGAADVEAAVRSGQRGFETWRRYSPQSRAAAVRELAAHIRTHADELGFLDAVDGGSSVTSMRKDALWAADHLEMFADWALMIKGETYPGSGTGLHYSRPVPYGVVGRIIPFNHPIFFGAGKLGAPLMAGNAVVLKPPPQAPLSAIRLGELIADVLPPGVVTIVNGASPEPGVAIAAHPEIERIAFIGSERTGRDIQRVAAGAAVKHVSLELGGKNAMVVLGDADIEAAAQGAVFGMNFTATQGESCGSNSRLLVHRSIAEQVVARVVELVEQIEVGVPISESTQMGALVSREHYERVMGYIEAGRREGAVLATGGGRPAHLPTGYFLAPTVFDQVTPSMTVAQEEIFGPVLSVLTFDDDDEAVRIANGVRYGLTASVWTQDVDRAHRFVDDLEAGYLWINDSSRHFPGLPFGGVKASGLGKEESLEEILSFTQTKTVSIPRRGL